MFSGKRERYTVIGSLVIGIPILLYIYFPGLLMGLIGMDSGSSQQPTQQKKQVAANNTGSESEAKSETNESSASESSENNEQDKSEDGNNNKQEDEVETNQSKDTKEKSSPPSFGDIGSTEKNSNQSSNEDTKAGEDDSADLASDQNLNMNEKAATKSESKQNKAQQPSEQAQKQASNTDKSPQQKRQESPRQQVPQEITNEIKNLPKLAADPFTGRMRRLMMLDQQIREMKKKRQLQKLRKQIQETEQKLMAAQQKSGDESDTDDGKITTRERTIIEQLIEEKMEKQNLSNQQKQNTAEQQQNEEKKQRQREIQQAKQRVSNLPVSVRTILNTDDANYAAKIQYRGQSITVRPETNLGGGYVVSDVDENGVTIMDAEYGVSSYFPTSG